MNEQHEQGMKVRREVLGDEHVDRAIERTTRVHGRLPGPDHAVRLGGDLGAAGARPPDAQLHHARPPSSRSVARRSSPCTSVRPCAIGLTPDEIKEVLLQSAIYCGVPAANGAFAVAQRVLDEIGPTARTDAHAGRHRRRRACRSHARSPAAPRRHRVGRAREPQPRATSSSASERACSSRRSPTSSSTPASASGCNARGSSTTASSSSSTASATGSR